MPTPKIENLETDRIAHIMGIALNEFAQSDYQSSSFNRIIRNTGMSKGTMYYYFKSKEDLYLTLLKASKKEFSQLSQLQIKNVNEPTVFWAQIDQLIKYVLQELEQKKTLGQFLRRLLTAQNRSSNSPASQTIADIEDWMGDTLLSGQLVGAVRRDVPLEFLINLIWSLWETVDNWRTATGLSVDETKQLLCGLLKKTLGCEQEDTSRDGYKANL